MPVLDFDRDSVRVIGEVGSITFTFIADEAMNAGDVCYLKTNGRLGKANATSSATSSGNLYLVVSVPPDRKDGSAAAGDAVSGLFVGDVSLNASLEVGKFYFTSTTAGGIHTTPVGEFRIIGSPRTANIFSFNGSAQAPGYY